MLIRKFKNSKIVNQCFWYSVIGIASFLIDLLVLMSLKNMGMYYLLAASISFVVSVIYNYIGTVNVVFVTKDRSIKKKIMFLILSMIGLLFNNLLLYLFFEKASIMLEFSKLLSALIVAIYNFITRKVFIGD